MCGMILMSLSLPPLPSSNRSSSCRSSSNLLGYLPTTKLTLPLPDKTQQYNQLPATKAVNELLNEKVKARSSSSKKNDNPHAAWDFPTIEWSFNEDDDDEEDDDNTEIDFSIKSAPARFQHTKAPRRGSLVRSISLVSSILHEMKRPCASADFPPVSKKRRNKTLAHHKSRHPKFTSSHPRLVALKHPTTSKGLQAGHHEGTQKYFL